MGRILCKAVEAPYRERTTNLNTRTSEDTHPHEQHSLACPIGRVASKSTMHDHAIRLGGLRLVQVRSATLERHLSLDGDIEIRPHEGALFEGQRVQDHTHAL